jgi:hypothetical protein
MGIVEWNVSCAPRNYVADRFWRTGLKKPCATTGLWAYRATVSVRKIPRRSSCEHDE